MKLRGITNINARCLLTQRKTTRQRIKTEPTASTTTTMTATNLSLVAANSHLIASPSSSSSNTTARPSPNTTNSSNDCEMLNLNYQQRSSTTTNISNAPGALGGYHQPPQQIIAVNQFTTNQYIINTGGQPVMGSQVLPTSLTAPDNLMKLTAASNTASAVYGNTGGYYTSSAGAVAPSGSNWYNSNDFNLDLNNNPIGVDPSDS